MYPNPIVWDFPVFETIRLLELQGFTCVHVKFNFLTDGHDDALKPFQTEREYVNHKQGNMVHGATQ